MYFTPYYCKSRMYVVISGALYIHVYYMSLSDIYNLIT